MKSLKESLFDSGTQMTESLFDKDLVKKEPVDFSYFKTNDKQIRYEIFEILNILTSQQPNMDYYADWISECYREHKIAFDYIVQCLYNAFNKQHFHSWIDISESEFGKIEEEMTEDEIDDKNNELSILFRKAYKTENQGRFLIQKGKIPDIIIDIIKRAGYWDDSLLKCDVWAASYWPTYGPTLSFYGCPKGLTPEIKKLLYN